jgi:hypothetical protein
MILFILDQFVICEPLCRVPQDINPDSTTKSAPVGVESKKSTKPPTPNTEETAKESLKPSSSGGAQTPSMLVVLHLHLLELLRVPTLRVPPLAQNQESPRTSPTSPQSYGLGAANGYHPREGSFAPWPKKPLR